MSTTGGHTSYETGEDANITMAIDFLSFSLQVSRETEQRINFTAQLLRFVIISFNQLLLLVFNGGSSAYRSRLSETVTLRVGVRILYVYVYDKKAILP